MNNENFKNNKTAMFVLPDKCPNCSMEFPEEIKEIFRNDPDAKFAPCCAYKLR